MSHRFPYAGAPVDGAPFYVMLATPIAEKPCASYAVSLAATAQALTVSGIRFDIETLVGCCHVDDARNIIMRNFLQSDCTDLFFIDADMGWSPNNVARLLRLPGDIIAGVYIKKSDDEDYPFHPYPGETHSNADGLYRMPKAATGFMRIRRHVIQALYTREQEKGRLMWLDGDGAHLNKLPVARICERGFVKELGLESYAADHASQSGDYVMCLKARSLGFDIYTQPDMAFNHSGEKTWHGHFGNHLRRKQGIDHPRFAEALQEIAKATFPDLRWFEQLVEYSVFSPNAALPPAILRECWEMAVYSRGDVLECGSGLSTLVMGIAAQWAQEKRPRRVYSLECDLTWCERVHAWLDRYGIGNVKLIYAPLMPGTWGHWYGVDKLELPAFFDGVLVDGPRRAHNVDRDTVFSYLSDEIRNAKMWIVDDVEAHSYQDKLAMLGRDMQVKVTEHSGVSRATAFMTLPTVKQEAAE